MRKYYIGIDGGGTKTDVVLFTSDGDIISRIIGKGTNLNASNEKVIINHFQSIFEQLFKGKKINKISGCFAGLSGSDHPLLTNKLSKCIKNTCSTPIEHLNVGIDAMNALWSGTYGAPGLVVIAGTGSIAYGILKNDMDFRIGGWGYLFGDEGSGYDIGSQTVRNVLKVYDGRTQKTELTHVVLEYFDIRSIGDIIPIVYGTSKQKIAGLAPLVDEAARNGDQVARKIMNNAANSLAQLIQSGLEHFDEKIDVVLTGGVWKSKFIRNFISQQMNQNFILPQCPPVFGSIAKIVSQYEFESKPALLEKIKFQLA